MSSATIATPPLRPAQTRPRLRARLWIDFFLVSFMLVNLVWAMYAAQWSEGLDRLFPVVVIAVTAGTLIALSGFGRIFAFTYSVIVGLAAILWSLAALAPEGLFAQDRVLYVIDRVITWVISAVNGEPIADNLVFILLLSAIIWIIGFSAVWTYFRDWRKWQTVLPTGLAMVVNLYYAPPQLGAYFVIYLLCAILLLVRATLVEREVEWTAARVHFPYDISFDFMRDGILFAVFVIFTSWVLPTAAGNGQLHNLLDPLQRPWQSFQDEWNRLFSTMNYGRTTGAPSFGTSLALGGPRDVTDEIVMDVDTPWDRYYRATVLDTYVQGGWLLQGAVGVRLDDSPDFSLPQWASRQPVTQTITVYQPTNVLLSAPQPIRAMVNTDARILPFAENEVPTQDDAAEVAELAMLVSRRSLNQGDSYVVTGSIVAASEAELRTAGSDYPDTIRDRYLSLPDTIPDRVLDLAEEVGAGIDNPYDVARRVESFLRNYTYNDQIPGPAPGQDGVDYFLFEERQGYCNYYASAMAVMLRHLGIPARLAVGYATGEYQPQTGLYRIRNYDSHTWVEVYFPNYGWVEFEPTSSEPVTLRPTGEIESAVDEGDAGGLGDADDENRNIPIPEEELPEINLPEGQTAFAWMEQRGGALLLIASILGIVLVVFWSGRRMRRPASRQRPVFQVVPDGFAPRLWQKLIIWAQRLRLMKSASFTPLEQAEVMTGAIPLASESIRTITNLYVKDQYSPHPITVDDASDAQYSWQTVRPLLWRHWLGQRLHLPKGLKRSLFRSKPEE